MQPNRSLVTLLWLVGTCAQVAEGAAVDVPAVGVQYKQYFRHFADRRSVSDAELAQRGLAPGTLGRSFALVAGVFTYPNLPPADRNLAAARADLGSLVEFLAKRQRFDEVVVLSDNDFNEANLRYFLESYFPARLRQFPRSRFVFAYSGHGMQEGERGYLLQTGASSFVDKGHSMSLDVLRAMFDEVLGAAFSSLMLVSACHSGAFHGSQAPTIAARVGERGVHAITASSEDQVAWHDSSLGPGSIFVESVLDGLSGSADGFTVKGRAAGDGIVSLSELWAFLSKAVPEATSGRQTPEISDLSLSGSSPGGIFFLADTAGGGERESVRSDSGAELTIADPLQPILARLLNALAAGREDDAASLAEEACQRGSAEGCLHLGVMLVSGTPTVRRDPVRASRLVEGACENGLAQGCLYLAKMKEQGYGAIKRDEAMARRLFGRACDEGLVMGCGSLAWLLANSGSPSKADLMKAVDLWRAACDGGDNRSCARLGTMYAEGEGGLPRDPKAAALLYARACAGEDSLGCALSARNQLESAHTAPGDRGVAADQLERSCNTGEASSCSRLGAMYLGGSSGLAVAPEKAVRLFERACAEDDPVGCGTLAYLFGHGMGGLPRDSAKAEAFARKACRQTTAEVCSSIQVAARGEE